MKLKTIEIDFWADAPVNFTGIIKYKCGSVTYVKDGSWHREDGPARERPNGYKAWWLNDKRHREDGPAIEYANGNKAWYLNDMLHREDGPAIERTDGYKAWYLNGKEYTKQTYYKILYHRKKITKEELLINLL